MMTCWGGLVSKIFLSGDVEFVDSSEDGVEDGAGGDDERDISKLAADDCRLRKRFRKRRCLMLDGDIPRPWKKQKLDRLEKE